MRKIMVDNLTQQQIVLHERTSTEYLMNPLAKKGLTLLEYHQLEGSTGTRYEYHDGEVFVMAGGTLEYSAITAALLERIRTETIDPVTELFCSQQQNHWFSA